jgi:hypothetical protein
MIPPTVRTDLHLHVALTRKTKGETCEPSKKSNALSEIEEIWIGKYVHLSFKAITLMVHLTTLVVSQIIYSIRCYHD